MVRTAPKNEKGEPICPVWWKNRLYEEKQCGAKIVRKKRAYTMFPDVGPMMANPPEGGRVGEIVEWWVYECENHHILYRPKEWADVPEEPIEKDLYGNTIRWPEDYYEAQLRMREELDKLKQ